MRRSVANRSSNYSINVMSHVGCIFDLNVSMYMSLCHRVDREKYLYNLCMYMSVMWYVKPPPPVSPSALSTLN